MSVIVVNSCGATETYTILLSFYTPRKSEYTVNLFDLPLKTAGSDRPSRPRSILELEVKQARGKMIVVATKIETE